MNTLLAFAQAPRLHSLPIRHDASTTISRRGCARSGASPCSADRGVVVAERVGDTAPGHARRAHFRAPPAVNFTSDSPYKTNRGDGLAARGRGRATSGTRSRTCGRRLPSREPGRGSEGAQRYTMQTAEWGDTISLRDCNRNAALACPPGRVIGLEHSNRIDAFVVRSLEFGVWSSAFGVWSEYSKRWRLCRGPDALA